MLSKYIRPINYVGKTYLSQKLIYYYIQTIIFYDLFQKSYFNTLDLAKCPRNY